MNVLIIGFIIAVATISALALRLLRIKGEYRHVIKILKQSNLEERDQRRVYERALALPVHTQEARDEALWARAAQGDEIATYILHETLAAELDPELFRKETGERR